MLSKCACSPSITDLDGLVVTCDWCRRNWYKPVPANQGAEYSEEYKRMPHVYKYEYGGLRLNSPQDVNGVVPIPDVATRRPEVLNSRTYHHRGVYITLTEHEGKPLECLLDGYATPENRALAGMITLAFRNSAPVTVVLGAMPDGSGEFLRHLRHALEDFGRGLEGRVSVAKDIAVVFEEGSR